MDGEIGTVLLSRTDFSRTRTRTDKDLGSEDKNEDKDSNFKY